MSRPKSLPRPEPTIRERAAMAAASESQDRRAERMRVSAKADGPGQLSLSEPHSDFEGWQKQLRETFGTTAGAFSAVAMSRLGPLLAGQGETMPSEAAMNAALAFLGAIGPKDELEATLAVQMLASHFVSLEMLARARIAGRLDHMQTYGALGVKLQRTFTAQIEALAKLRGGGKQQVEVRHVYINAQNAVVGDIHQGGGGHSAKPADQPHGPAIPYLPTDAMSALWSAEPLGGAVHEPSHAGPDPMQDARRGAGERSAEGPGKRTIPHRVLDGRSGRRAARTAADGAPVQGQLGVKTPARGGS